MKKNTVNQTSPHIQTHIHTADSEGKLSPFSPIPFTTVPVVPAATAVTGSREKKSRTS